MRVAVADFSLTILPVVSRGRKALQRMAQSAAARVLGRQGNSQARGRHPLSLKSL